MIDVIASPATDITPKNLKLSPHRTKIAVREIADTQLAHDSNSIAISHQEFANIITSLKSASRAFTTLAKSQIENRARSLFSTPTPTPEQKIKTAFSHRDFGRTKGNVLKDADAMRMIDQALSSDAQEVRLFCTGFPMKVFSPLETDYQGDSVDLGDISVLLRFAELAEVLTYFGAPIGKKFSVVIVSDGQMNAGMFKVDTQVCESYVAKLNTMIEELGIEAFVSVKEFSSLLAANRNQSSEYERATKRIKAECHARFGHLLDLESLERSIDAALDQEHRHHQGSSFGQLFHSTIGSVRYEGIEQLSKKYGLDFLKTYAMLLESILWDQKIEHTISYTSISAGLQKDIKESLLEALTQERVMTMQKAWHSTIEYYAVLEANRATSILDSLIPDGIRVTTRPKKGQIGIHTSDQNSPTLFSYHSVPVIMPCNKGRNVKIDFQLKFHALRDRHHPVSLNGTDVICYKHSDISSLPIEQLPWVRGSK